VRVRDVRAYPHRVTAQLFSLEALGWDDSWRELASAYDGCGDPGRIVRVDRGLFGVATREGLVRASLGGAVLDALAKDAGAAPCTGDWCVVREWCDGPVTVEAVLPRRTAVTRAEAGGTSRGQVLAANIDVAAVVVALHPEPRLARVERLLAIAWASGATPMVVLTKADLVVDADLVAEDVRVVAPGVEVICCSTVSRLGIERLRAMSGEGRTIGLLGASGHGKSSLVNALAGAEVLAVERIRADGKGRHTSVRRELVLTPGGGLVIDTPGLRGVGLQQAETGLSSAFPDIVALAQQCHFADCGHEDEPRCAVLEAVGEGRLAVRRLDSWRALRREAASMGTRSAARRRRAQGKRPRRLATRQRETRRGVRR